MSVEGASKTETEQTEEMREYKHLAGEEEVRLETSGSAMYERIAGLVRAVRSWDMQDTEYGKCFGKALETAHVIREELLHHKKRRYVYAPQRYRTARENVDKGVKLLGELEGFAKMKEGGIECQQKMDEYAGVWQKILEFDKEHWNPYLQRTVFGRHAFSGQKASMEEMLRDLQLMGC